MTEPNSKREWKILEAETILEIKTQKTQTMEEVIERLNIVSFDRSIRRLYRNYHVEEESLEIPGSRAG